MEALHSRLTTGEQSRGQEHSQPESAHRDPQLKSPSQHRQPQQPGPHQPHETIQQQKPPRRQPPERKRLRHQRQSIDSDTALEGKQADATTTKATRVQSSSSGAPGPSTSSATQSKQDTQEGTPKQKRERKPQRPGKYVCTYCGRACAKPSVLQKHIRSHTGERPYPCAPCGFSFKTKSNLYKHRKSHTHRVKAGLASGEPRSVEEPVTESEDETRHLTSPKSNLERQESSTSHNSHDTDRLKDQPGGMDNSYAVKKRLAMRLSRGKRSPLDSSDDKGSSLILASGGSTESGYFSRSESTEQSQDSPPNPTTKSYAEIILGKYGRIGQLHRMSRHQNQQPSGQEEKTIPFTVPKKQVIDHITKLITINEAVVDTSKIDSVKPRRFSLSRKSSTESQKTASVKEPVIHSPTGRDSAYKNSGSITMGVPCEKFHHQSLTMEPVAGQTSTAPLLRSHSMPSAASSFDPSSGSPRRFRLSQSFDERQPSETQASRRYGRLRRQPAIEIPLGAELSKEDLPTSHPFYHDSLTGVPDHKQCQPQPYECESCGTGCKDWEGYKTHKQSQCMAQHPLASGEATVCQLDRPQLIHHPIRPGALAMRKRRKEESFEFDDPSSPAPSSSPAPAFSSTVQYRDESSVSYDCPRRPTVKPFSVIQHTSSFEKLESLSAETQSTEGTIINMQSHEDYHQPVPQTQTQQQSTKLTTHKLVRQHSVQVPEILVTEDSNMNTESSTQSSSATKTTDKPDEFQWPQRSPTLAQLPIEKLPPKKKRLRLAEVAQSSGESSFDSLSLPRSPSQDSSASYASSRSTSFEEPNRPDMEKITPAAPLRRSRAPNMLTVPGLHQHREMRRSASEQAPHDPQQGVIMAETRSKSFDYSCLSPERTAIGWRERRKCLLMRHSAVKDPDEDEEIQPPRCSPGPDPVRSHTSSRASPGAGNYNRSPTSPLSGDILSSNPTQSPHREVFSQWKLSQNIHLTESTELKPIYDQTVDTLKVVTSVHTGQPPGATLQSTQTYLTPGPSGAARAHYLPMSTGLKLEIPNYPYDEYTSVQTNPPHAPHTLPNIIPNRDLIRPPTLPTIAVRLHADTPTPAYAIYTTLCQTTPSRSQEPVCSMSHYTTIPTSQHRSQSEASSGVQAWSEDRLRSSGSGGNKRMLSPSNSIELSPESMQQQKRVKEGEDKKGGRVNEALAETSKEESELENHLCLPSVGSPVRQREPSFPSLQSNTCNSWCYLNYVKPNPSTLDEQEPSVYSSWSTSGYNPNPMGLSSKAVMSLLHCKQRLSPSIYTMSPMSVNTVEYLEPEDSKQLCCTQVCSSQPYDGDHTRTKEGEPLVEYSRQNKGKEEAEEEEEKEKEDRNEGEVQSSHKYKQPPRVWLCVGGSEAKRESAHDGDGGRRVREEFECCLKNPSGSREHTGLHTVSRPCVCKDCSSQFKTKGNIIECMRSQVHGKKDTQHSLDETDKGVCEDASVCPKELKDIRQHSAPEERRGKKDAADEDDKDRKSQMLTNPPSSSCQSPKAADQAARQPRQPDPGRPLAQTPKDPPQKSVASSASAKRALFARRHQEPTVASPSAAASPSPSHQPVAQRLSPAHAQSPRRESPPLQSPSPRPRMSPVPLHLSPPTSMSLSGSYTSSSPVRRVVSPVRGLSPPVRVRSASPWPLDSSGSTAGSPAQDQAYLPRDTPSSTPTRDRLAAATSKARLQRAQSVDEGGHVAPHPPQARGARSVLSHLPLHSQQPARTPNLMIPIGGIHMIQARTTPLYSLVRSPVSAPTSPRPNSESEGPSSAPAGRSPPTPQHQDTLKETGRHGQSDSRGTRAEGRAAAVRQPASRNTDGGGSPVEGRSPRPTGSLSSKAKTSGSSVPADERSPSAAKASTLYQGVTDTRAPRRSAHLAVAQGQKAPSSQTQL